MEGEVKCLEGNSHGLRLLILMKTPFLDFCHPDKLADRRKGVFIIVIILVLQQGTGSDLNWTNLPLGTYTVRGHRTATYMYQDMSGSATILNTTNGITEVKSNAVHVYPNPAKETLTITFDQPISGEGTLEIWSITGDKLLSNYTIPTTSIQQKVDVSNLSSGNYFYILKYFAQLLLVHH